MALPKLNDKPKYDLIIPSTQQKIRFRPYLVKEEKVLMMAMESEDQVQIFESIVDTIVACVDEPINRTLLTSFDVEFMFVKIRSKSVGETIKLSPNCEHCEEPNAVEIVLDEVNIDVPDVDYIIPLNEDVSVKMKYPSYVGMIDEDILNAESNTKQTFAMILKCIESVITEDEIMIFKEESIESQMEFIESLNSAQFDLIRKFIETMPQISHDATYKCKKCKKKNNLMLRGMTDFF